MSRTINILVDGSHLTKDRGTAGVQHEGNSTVLRIQFDETWDNLAKSVTWWNAKGLNPVVRVLTVDMLEDIQTSTRVYRCPIPAEPLTEAGMCTFVIDGFLNGKRQRTVADQLKVTAAPYAANAGTTADPTPTQAEQLQEQIEGILPDIREHTIRAEAARTGAESAAAIAETARTSAEGHSTSAQGNAQKAAQSASTAVSGAADAKAWAQKAQAEAERAAVPAVEGVYNVVMVDRVTGDKYALIVENGVLHMLSVRYGAGTKDVVLIDSTTGLAYQIISENGVLKLMEV